MDLKIITDVVSTLGVGGILAWYLYFTTSVALPKRDKHYTDSMERIASQFAATLTEERSYRRQEIAELKNFIEHAAEATCRYNADHPKKGT